MRKKLQKFNCQRTKKNHFDVFIQRYNKPPGLEFRPQPAAWRLKEGRKSYAGIDPISSILSFQSSRRIVHNHTRGWRESTYKKIGRKTNLTRIGEYKTRAAAAYKS
jgi:hypothetical protein